MLRDEKKVYCIHCGGMRGYKRQVSREEMTVRGTAFRYLEQAVFCTECGEEVYVPEINDRNTEARECAYRADRRLED